MAVVQNQRIFHHFSLSHGNEIEKLIILVFTKIEYHFYTFTKNAKLTMKSIHVNIPISFRISSDN